MLHARVMRAELGGAARVRRPLARGGARGASPRWSAAISSRVVADREAPGPLRPGEALSAAARLREVEAKTAVARAPQRPERDGTGI